MGRIILIAAYIFDVRKGNWATIRRSAWTTNGAWENCGSRSFGSTIFGTPMRSTASGPGMTLRRFRRISDTPPPPSLLALMPTQRPAWSGKVPVGWMILFSGWPLPRRFLQVQKIHKGETYLGTDLGTLESDLKSKNIQRLKSRSLPLNIENPEHFRVRDWWGKVDSNHRKHC